MLNTAREARGFRVMCFYFSTSVYLQETWTARGHVGPHRAVNEPKKHHRHSQSFGNVNQWLNTINPFQLIK